MRGKAGKGSAVGRSWCFARARGGVRRPRGVRGPAARCGLFLRRATRSLAAAPRHLLCRCRERMIAGWIRAGASDVEPPPRTIPEPLPRGGLLGTLLVIAFAVGVGVATIAEPVGAEPLPTAIARGWWTLGAASLAVFVALGALFGACGCGCGRARASVPADRARAVALVLLAVGSAALGAAWWTVRQPAQGVGLAGVLAETGAVGDRPTAPAMGPGDRRLVRVRGVLVDAPRRRERRGSLAAFDRREPQVAATIWVREVAPEDRTWIALEGRVLLVMDEAPARVLRLEAGESVEALGILSTFRPPANPGEFDARRWARRRGVAGSLFVDAAAHVRVLPTSPWPWTARFASVRAVLRRGAEEALLADVPVAGAPEREALCRAMFLGERTAALDPVMESFRRTGLAHVVAISGFNLGVLAGAVLLIVRLRRGGRRWQAAATLLAIVPYLAVVEPETPVIRAGVMVAVAAFGCLLERRWRMNGVLVLSAACILLWDPGQAIEPGFQLSFGAVAALGTLGPFLRQQWFGPADRAAWRARSMLLEHTKTALAAASAAWIASVPVVMVHFGFVSPWGIPLSLVTAPVATALLCTGYLKLLATPLAPPVGWLLGPPLAWLADALIAMIVAAGRLPAAGVDLPPPPPAWGVLCVLALLAWMRLREPRHLRVLAAFAVGLVLWALVPAVWLRVRPSSWSPAMRIDMLAVGDGTSILLRGDGAAVVFDAGSTALSIGGRVVVPALRALGVTSVDAIVVSHANLDHFAAVLEIADALPVREVIVTAPFRDAASRAPHGAAAALLHRLAQRRINVVEAMAGDERTFGSMRWRWLHPPSGASFAQVNDASQVVRVAAGGRTMLLCGDIQDAAIEALLAGTALLRADILELPHHGSWRPAAASLVEAVRPAIVLQSTGPARLVADRWAARLASAERLVTARDGAVWVEIGWNGELHAGRWFERPDGMGPEGGAAPLAATAASTSAR